MFSSVRSFRPARVRRIAAVTALAGASGVLVLAGTGSASAATTAAPASAWDAVAQCESGGNWAANTGNGYTGGLQFTSSTWAAYGGTQYASSADQASKSEQITVANKVLADQGATAWPNCGTSL